MKRLIFPAIAIVVFIIMGAIDRPVFEAPEPWIDYPNPGHVKDTILIHDTVWICPESDSLDFMDWLQQVDSTIKTIQKDTAWQ